MTLDEWCGLTAEERNRLRMEWAQAAFKLAQETYPPANIEGTYQQLIDEATERFKAAYGRHPLINNIHASSQFYEGSEPGITVATALFTPQIIEELPDRYFTFAVQQYQTEDAKHAYLRAWEVTLGHFLGWSKDQVHEWGMGMWKDELEGRVGIFFYHEPPHHYVVPLLIPASLADKVVGLAGVRLRQDIEEAIRCTAGVDPSDWNAAKERVAKILADFERAVTDAS